MHRGDFVDLPRHTGGHAPHWSRWEATDTTFGPVGRIAWTVVVAVFVLSSVPNPMLLLASVPIGGWIVKDLWRPGWVVPDDVTPRAARVPHMPLRQWLFDRDELLRHALLAAVALAITAVVLFAPTEMRFATIAGTTLLGAYLLLRRLSY